MAGPLMPGEFVPDDHDFGRVTYTPVAAGPPPAEDSSPRQSANPSRSGSAVRLRSRSTSAHGRGPGLRARLGLLGVARRTLGILLLLFTVFMWTLSNFLASYIFSDNTYSKPFFLVYVNTSIFAVSLVPMGIRYVVQNGFGALCAEVVEMWREQRHGMLPIKSQDEEVGEDGGDDETGALLVDDEPSLEVLNLGRRRSRSRRRAKKGADGNEKLSARETAWLSLEFCMLWFLANYFASACLEYTSVASATILTSTSSIWTLIACAVTGVEAFTMRKLVGVVASMAGVILISSVDLSGQSNDNRGNFPLKTTAQIAIGDAMAFISAIIYGIYVTVMKRRVGNEDRVNMPLFFGLVGLLNLLFLWPGFFILHFTGIETFEMPPTATIWTIILVNSVASFLSDMSWAYAMLLTTPLVVTVGISLTIPLSLVGEMIQYAQFSSWVYWVGAGIVFISFVFVNHESQDGEDESDKEQRTELADEIHRSVDSPPSTA